jgi:flagellar FliJ protein
MAKFVFKLQAVLRQRKHVEQDKQRQLAQRQSKLLELQNLLLQMQQTVQNSNEDLRQNRLVGRLDMGFIAAHRRFLTGIQRQAVAMAQKIALAQRAVDDARAELAEAAKQRKIMEKLRERQLDRWRAEQSRRELADLDEVGMQLAYQGLTPASDQGSGSSESIE